MRCRRSCEYMGMATGAFKPPAVVTSDSSPTADVAAVPGVVLLAALVAARRQGMIMTDGVEQWMHRDSCCINPYGSGISSVSKGPDSLIRSPGEGVSQARVPWPTNPH